MSIRRFIRILHTTHGPLLQLRGTAGDITWFVLAAACPVKDSRSLRGVH